MVQPYSHPLLLTTALSSPLSSLETSFLRHKQEIEAWLEKQWAKTPPPFYSSVDLRNAGFKLAPVDANLFPAGFNNISPSLLPHCIQTAKTTLEAMAPNTKTILLIPEDHTRNSFYLENLARLYDILLQTGVKVRISSLRNDFQTPETITLPSGRQLSLEPFAGQKAGDPKNTLILLNNDSSAGVSDLLQKSVYPIYPALHMSWSSRSKATHFSHYRNIAEELSLVLNIDPWLINPLFYHCGNINFMKQEGEACLIDNTQRLITAIQEKYHQYGIKQQPFVVIKADSGTYGMAVMMVTSPDELRHLNRKQRTQMSTSKGGRPVSKVILQEGIPSIETQKNATAEPVLYMIGKEVVGGFYRAHPHKSAYDNLNSPGMQFEPLTIIDPETSSIEDPRHRFYTYSVIARLATLACAREATSP